MEIEHVFDPSEEILHYTEKYKLMCLYTRTISTMMETYVEARVVSDAGKKTRKACRRERQIRERTRKVSVSDVLMTLALVNKRKKGSSIV
jgi:hypothetical protein